MNRIFLFFIAPLFFLSCTKEVARVDVANQSNIFIKLNCKKNQQVNLYIDFDIEYTKYPIMVMDFEFYKGNEQLLKGGLDPLFVSSNKKETKVTTNGVTHWKLYGKLEGDFMPPSDTIFTIHPTLIKNNHPGLVMHKFELVLVK